MNSAFCRRRFAALRHWSDSLIEWLSSPTGAQRQFRHGLTMLAVTSATGVLGYMIL